MSQGALGFLHRRIRRFRTRKISCPICRQYTTLRHMPYKNVGPHANPIFKDIKVASCSECASSWVTDPPSAEALEKYYELTYTPSKVKNLEERAWPTYDARAVSLICMGRLFKQINNNSVFLDIGPGCGDALSMAGYLLPNPKLACIEFNQRTISFLKTKFSDIFVAHSAREILSKFGRDGVQFLYSAHCFEHFRISDLRSLLAELHAVLSEDGVMSIEVPHHHVQRLDKVTAFAPHLIFFSKQGLTALLVAAGFDVKLCISVFGRFGRQYIDQLANNGRSPSDPLGRRLGILNTGDWIGARPGVVIKCIATKK